MSCELVFSPLVVLPECGRYSRLQTRMREIYLYPLYHELINPVSAELGLNTQHSDRRRIRFDGGCPTMTSTLFWGLDDCTGAVTTLGPGCLGLDTI